jgi:monoamine oxidase
MPRTPLADALSRIAAERAAATRHTRRAFLGRAAGAAAAATALPAATGLSGVARAAAGGPRIVVIGAGLAGLTCAYRLRQAC